MKNAKLKLAEFNIYLKNSCMLAFILNNINKYKKNTFTAIAPKGLNMNNPRCNRGQATPLTLSPEGAQQSRI